MTFEGNNDVKKSPQFYNEEHSLLDVNDSLPSQVARQNFRSTVMDANRYNVEAMNPVAVANCNPRKLYDGWFVQPLFHNTDGS